MTEESVLKRATAYSVLLMLFAFFFAAYFKDGSEGVSHASEIKLTPPVSEHDMSAIVDNSANSDSMIISVWSNIAGKDYSKLAEQIGEKCIIIQKPENLSKLEKLTMKDLAVDCSIIIQIDNLVSTNISENEIGRIYGDNLMYGATKNSTSSEDTTIELDIIEFESASDEHVTEEVMNTVYSNRMSGKEPPTIDILSEENSDNSIVDLKNAWTDPIKSFEIAYSDANESETYTAFITIVLDTTYAYKVYEDDYNYYIALLRPKDVYDKIVVIDAGHGGLDSGTYSKNNEHLEKDMNLSMLLYLVEYLKQEDIKVYSTRTTDRKLTLSQRVSLANAVEADMFLSIHCNANLITGIQGIEVLYNEKQNDWETFNSKQFSKLCLEEVNKRIQRVNRGLVPRSHNVQIIGDSQVPVALIEVGFMSNTNDLSFLLKEENRKLVAEGMYHAILRGYDVINK